MANEEDKDKEDNNETDSDYDNYYEERESMFDNISRKSLNNIGENSERFADRS